MCCCVMQSVEGQGEDVSGSQSYAVWTTIMREQTYT